MAQGARSTRSSTPHDEPPYRNRLELVAPARQAKKNRPRYDTGGDVPNAGAGQGDEIDGCDTARIEAAGRGHE